MSTSDDCLFCKIARGDIKAAITYRDDRTVAFKDIGPTQPSAPRRAASPKTASASS
jgi:hypothetical protein